MSTKSKFAMKAAAVSGTAMVFASLLASPAHALGERVVHRHCGSNHIGSVQLDSNTWFAYTDAARSSHCAGQLGVQLIYPDGETSDIVWGTNEQVDIETSTRIIGANHYGCRSCNPSTT